MRYLVTGGAGFIGSHLVDRLLAQGHRVLVLDDLSTGSSLNLMRHREHGELSFLQASVCDADLLRRLMGDVDFVFHLAAVVGVQLLMRHPRRALEVNLLGSEAVLDAAEAAGVPMLMTSSSEVYGLGPGAPFREDVDLQPGRSDDVRGGYAFSKAMAECSALARAREGSLQVTIVRLFNTVGPRQTGEYGMVLPRFLSQALRGEPLTVFGDGAQTRCFADVGEVVDCMLRLVEEPKSQGRIFNLGSDREVTIAELAETVRRLTGSDSRVQYMPLREVLHRGTRDVLRRVPDLGRLVECIGCKPDMDLETIVRGLLVPASSS
ncbi:MAG: NAD-dependent epimerase/dehydratase family protein [Planctomycetota bacterium]|jgi:UDP-glucose 4-epimerase